MFDSQFVSLLTEIGSSKKSAYIDKLQQIISSSERSGAAVYVREIPNTVNGWNQKHNADKILDSLDAPLDKVHFITVARTQVDKLYEASDAGNLIYFFLDWLALAESGVGRCKFRYTLVVDAPKQPIEKESQRDDDYYRVSTMMSLILGVLQGHNVDVHLLQSADDNGNRILKQVFATGLSKKNIAYWRSLSGIVPALPVYLDTCGASQPKYPFIPLTSLQSADAGFSREDFDRIERGESIARRSKENEILAALRVVAAGLISNLENRLSGTLSKSLSAEGKRSIKMEVISVLKERLPSSNILAQFIFSYLASYALRQKSLLGLAGDDEDALIRDRKNLAEMAFESLSYAEGLYQLVENACLHTRDGIALVCIKCYDLNRSRTGRATNEEMKALSRKRMLEQRYLSSKSKTGLAAGYWMEIRVLDIARKPSDGAVQGITGSYWAAKGDRSGGVNINSIASMLSHQERPGRLGDVIIHYGLRMLLKIARGEGGAIRIGTPSCLTEGSLVWRSGLMSSDWDIRSGKESHLVASYRFTEVSLIAPAVHAKPPFSSPSSAHSRRLYDGSRLGVKYESRIHTVTVERNEDVGKARLRWLEWDDNGSSKHLEDILDCSGIQPERKKEREVRFLRAKIQEHLAIDEDVPDRIDLIELRNDDLGSIELFAKGLYAASFLPKGRKLNRKLYVAVYFRKRSSLYHFLRVASVFYSKQANKEDYDRVGFQFYICSAPVRDPSELGSARVCPEVCFVLSDGSIETSAKTAEVFCYHYAGSTLDTVPFVSYLCSDSAIRRSGAGFDIDPLIPIDAFLEPVIEDDGTLVSSTDPMPWLIRRVQSIVNSEAGKDVAGCRRSDAHVHIGDRLHTGSFFDCTALFQNVALVKKLAFILASGMVEEGESSWGQGCELFVYGYEGYSALLVREIEGLLSDRLCRPGDEGSVCVGKVTSLIYSCDTESVSGLERIVSCLKSGGRPVILPVIPIATTCSTVHMMARQLAHCILDADYAVFPDLRVCRGGGEGDHDAAQAAQARDAIQRISSFEFDYQPASIVVLVFPDSQEHKGKSIEQFWSSKPDQIESGHTLSHIIEINPERKGDDSRRARWYVHAVADLIDPFGTECKYCKGWRERSDDGLLGEEQVLLSADRTGTVMRVAFASLSDQRTTPEENGFSDLDREVMPLLFGTVDYGHFNEGSCHSQYHIDAGKLMDRTIGSKGYRSWLDSLRKEVLGESYNVLIAPIESQESGFYGSLVNGVFESSIRYVHVRLDEEGVDDIRAHYSSIIEDLRFLVRSGRGSSVRFYYAQPCIRSGRMLRKAEAVVRMLRFEAGLDGGGSSFEAAYCLVSQAVEFISSAKRIEAFLSVNVPAVGIKSVACPICETMRLLRGAAGHCADEELADEFYSSARNLEPAGVESARDRFEADLLERQSYLLWYSEWVRYFGDKSPALIVGADVVGMKEELLKNAAKWASDSIGKEGPSSLAELDAAWFSSDNVRNDAELSRDYRPSHLMRSIVVAQRNMMRFICEDEFGNILGLDVPSARMQSASSERELVGKSVEAILKAICEKMEGVSNHYLQKEWLISFLKTASRGRFMRVHHAKQAMLTVVTNLVHGILHNDYMKENDGQSPSDPSAIGYCKSVLGMVKQFEPVLEYQVLETLVNRLGDLGSTYILDGDNIRMIYACLKKLLSGQEESKSVRFRAIDEDGLRKTIRMAIGKSVYSCADGSRAALADGLLQSNDAKRDNPDEPENGNDASQDILIELKRFVPLCTTLTLHASVRRMWDLWNMIPVREGIIGLCEAPCEDNGSETQAPQNQKSIERSPKLDAIRKVYNEVIAGQCGSRPGERSDIGKVAAFIDRNLHCLYRKVAFAMVENLKESCRYEDDLLVMNPFSRFFDSPNGKQNVKDIASMVLLFKYAADLNGEAHVGIPLERRSQAYEGICNCIRDLLGAEVCYMVFLGRSEPRIVVGSSVDGDVLASEMEHDALRSWGDEYELANDAVEVMRHKEAHKGRYIEIRPHGDRGPFERRDAVDSRDGESGLVCFVPLGRSGSGDLAESDKVLSSMEIHPKEARNVLFARDELARAIDKDLSMLLSLNQDYSSVARLTCCNRNFRALHLSDLHIDAEKFGFYEQLVKRFRSCKEGVPDPPFDKDYDLVLVTGDIAEGARSGAGQEANYQAAGYFLRHLARYLWSDMDGCVRGDWKKRIVVIPGNHDYVSSSGFESVRFSRKRTSEVAKPVKQSIATPAKFIYYYDFLHAVFNADLGELWANSLNEVRNYDSLGLSIVMLNSSALSESLRNNKVGVMTEFDVGHFVDRITASNCVVVMSHHSPFYKPDYLLDEYCESAMYDARGGSRRLQEASYALLKFAGKCRVVKLSAELEGFHAIRSFADSWIQENCESVSSSLGARACEEFIIDDAFINEIVRHCLRARNHCALYATACSLSPDSIDEGVLEMASDLFHCLKMQEHDGRALREMFEELSSEARKTNGGRDLLFVSGHTHISSENSDRSIGTSKTLGKFHEKLKYLYYPDEGRNSTATGSNQRRIGFVAPVLKSGRHVGKKVCIGECEAVRFANVEGKCDSTLKYEFEGELNYGTDTEKTTIVIVEEGSYLDTDPESAPVLWQYRGEIWKCPIAIQDSAAPSDRERGGSNQLQLF